MTKVNWNRQLGLALVLFVFGTAAYWMEFKYKPQKEERMEEDKKVFSLKDAPVKSIELFNPSLTLMFECSDVKQGLCKVNDQSKWTLSQPSRLKADNTKVNALLDNLASLTPKETIDLSKDTPEKREELLKEYGLNAHARASALKVQLQILDPAKTIGSDASKAANGPKAKEGEPHSTQGSTLFLGDTHPLGESVFALRSNNSGEVDEKHVLLIPTHFKAHFDNGLTHWRDKKLVTLAAHEIEGFKLSGTNAVVSATRTQKQWTLDRVQDSSLGIKKFSKIAESPLGPTPGDAENIQGFLSSATYLVAKEFVSENKMDATSRKTLAGVKPFMALWLKGETPTKLTTGKNDSEDKQADEKIANKAADAELTPEVQIQFFQKVTPPKTQSAPPITQIYATVSNLDPLFELDPSAKVRIDKSLKELRLTQLLTSADRFEAKQIEFSGTPMGKTPVIVKDVSGKWVNASDQKEIEGKKIQGLLEKLSGNRIKGFVTGAKIPQGQQKGLIMQILNDKSEVKKELIFWKQGSQLVARDVKTNSPEAFLVDSAVTPALPWSQEFFVNPKPKPAKAAQPTKDEKTESSALPGHLAGHNDQS